MFKTINKIIMLCVISLISFSCSESEEQQVSIQISSITSNANSADSTFQDLSGQAIELDDFAGKKILLNYWATWCAPCIRELPALSRASKILNEDDFVVLMASDESIETITEFIDENNFEGSFIKLNSFFASHGVEAVPSTVLYSVDGEILNTWLGEYEWDSSEIIAQLQGLASSL